MRYLIMIRSKMLQLRFLTVFATLALVMFSTPSFAKSSKSSKSTQATNHTSKRTRTVPKDTKLETSLSFEGSKLKGKVQEASLRKIVVENDKYLEDLLGVRKNFDDRRAEEKERAEK